MCIIRNNLWMNITQAEEERAQSAIQRYENRTWGVRNVKLSGASQASHERGQERAAGGA